VSERDLSPLAETFALACSPAPELQPETALAKSEWRIADSVSQRVALSSAEEAQAASRLAIIQPLIDFELDQGMVARSQLHLDLGLRLPDGRPVNNSTRMVKYLAHTHALGRSTIWNWYKAYREDGKFGLVRDERSDKGKSRFFESHPKAAAVAAAMYLEQKKRGIKGIHRLLVTERKAFHFSEAELPSYDALRNWLQTTPVLTPAMRIMARDGLREYENRVAPYMSRKYVDIFANQIWVSDHKICDAEVQNDCFLGLPFGTPLRMRFTGIMDMRSRKIVGFAFAVEGSSMSILTAMRPALLSYGPPRSFYVDNGGDFRKVGRDICPLVGIAPQFCQRYHGQSKPIERQWRTMKDNLEVLFATYTGGKPEMRPDSTTVEMTRHRKLLAIGAPQLSNHPTASYFIRMAAAWIDQYNDTPHTGRGMDGRSPNDIFWAYPDPEQRPPLQPVDLVKTYVERCQRKIRECSITLENRRYIGADGVAARVLHDLAEEDVICTYDPNDGDNVAVLDMQNNFLCWAKPETLLPHSADAKLAIAAGVAQRRQLRNQTQDAIGEVQRLASASGARTELEILEQAARAVPIDPRQFVSQRATRLLRGGDNTAVAPLSAAEIARRAIARSRQGSSL
jgi:putative transposase